MAPFHVRRTDREITEDAVLASILQRGKYAAVAMCHNGEPYLVTLSYGYHADGRALYFHVAGEGRKLEAIAADPRVCATVVIDNGYEAGACKHHYESVVLTGRMAIVTDPDEARAGMRVLLAHLEAEPDSVWERNKLDLGAPWKRMRIVRLDIERMTGKVGS